jgi:hypothetical protein
MFNLRVKFNDFCVEMLPSLAVENKNIRFYLLDKMYVWNLKVLLKDERF